MKFLILLLFFTLPTWAKPLVLISYYDPFDEAPFNNSERIAKILEKSLGRVDSTIEVKLCALNTVFDVAFGQLEKCVKSLSAEPTLVLGLGESNCDMKVETVVRNFDKTIAPDNIGNERYKTSIIPEAPKLIGLQYPLPEMYCALNPEVRKAVTISNNAGSFVCNNTSFHLAYHYPELKQGFIHVPAHYCKNLELKTKAATQILETMILKAVSSKDKARSLPTSKAEYEKLREKYEDSDECLYEFFKRARGVDERGFWSIFG